MYLTHSNQIQIWINYKNFRNEKDAPENMPRVLCSCDYIF